MFKKVKMEILSVVFIVLGTLAGGYANWKKGKDSNALEDKNSKLLIENNDLTKELSKTTDENLALSKKFDRYVKELSYFNKVNYDNEILRKIFPNGYKVVAQNKDFENFSKNFGKNLSFELFESKIIFDDTYRFIMSDVRFKSSIMSWKSSKKGSQNVSVPINPKDYSNEQIILPFVVQPGYNFVVLMIDDGRTDFTYAVGFTPKEKIKPNEDRLNK